MVIALRNGNPSDVKAMYGLLHHEFSHADADCPISMTEVRKQLELEFGTEIHSEPMPMDQLLASASATEDELAIIAYALEEIEDPESE